MKRLPILTTLVVMLSMALTSCVSSKKIKYFQGSDTLFAQAQKISQTYEMRIKPADELLIRLTCSNEELLQPFTQTQTMGAGGQSSSASQAGGSMSHGIAFLVNKDGQIRLPQIGHLNVQGLTAHEAALFIEKKIKEKKLIPDPSCRVYIISARVTVIGAVNGPSVVNLSNERTTIFDVLIQCGDASDVSLRQKVRLFREENGKRKMYKLDLTKADIFSHPAYFVQQNDLIYIEPNKSQNIKSSPTSTFLAAGGSILGAVISLINMAFWIKRRF